MGSLNDDFIEDDIERFIPLSEKIAEIVVAKMMNEELDEIYMSDIVKIIDDFREKNPSIYVSPGMPMDVSMVLKRGGLYKVVNDKSD